MNNTMLDPTLTQQEGVAKIIREAEERVAKQKKQRPKKRLILRFSEWLINKIYLPVAVVSLIALGLTHWYLFVYSWIPQYAPYELTVPKANASVGVLSDNFNTIKEEWEVNVYPQKIKVSIKQLENSVAYRMNNPCNLKFAKQEGAKSGDRGFARFLTPEDGFRACIIQVQIDKKKNLRLGEFINKFAPPSENNTALYTKTVLDNLGAENKTLISEIDTIQLAKEMARLESQTNVIEL